MNLRPSGYEPDGHSWLPYPADFFLGLKLFYRFFSSFNLFFAFFGGSFVFFYFKTSLTFFFGFFFLLVVFFYLSNFLCFFCYFERPFNAVSITPNCFFMSFILFLLSTISIVPPHLGHLNWYSAATSNGTLSHICLHEKNT